jgi:ATP-dependent Lon protease
MAIQDLSACLDLKQNLNIYASCKQFDNLNLNLSIFDNSLQADLSGYTVKLRAMKADQVPLIQTANLNINNNVVNIVADSQLTTTSGDTLTELQFINNSTGEKKATFNLVLKVIPSTLEVNGTISTATYTLLEELENKIDQCSDFFENIDTAINLDNELKTNITNSETAKSNLENTTEVANESREELEGKTKIAQDTITDLIQTNEKYTEHINNADIHVTKVDKNKWDLTTLNLKQVINIIDKSIGNGTLLDENGQPLTDEDNIEFFG